MHIRLGYWLSQNFPRQYFCIDGSTRPGSIVANVFGAQVRDMKRGREGSHPFKGWKEGGIVGVREDLGEQFLRACLS